MLLKRPKALITLRQQGDPALKLRRVKETGPGLLPCRSGVPGQSWAEMLLWPVQSQQTMSRT
jgi:hypothetical protein